VKAVVFAYHDVGCMGVRVLKRLGVDVARVYTHDDDPNENHWYGSVAKTCAELGVACTTADPHDPAEIEKIRGAAPDAIFSLYYRDMIKDTVLSLAKRGAVNLHGSFLPRYRGRAPVNWQILHGETQGGVTLHFMVKKPDAGDIVDQESFEIGPDETGVQVYAKMLPAAERVLTRSAMSVLEGTAPRIRQMESKATYYGRRRPEDGLIDWRWCAEDVRNLVRAVTHPYPGAFTFAGGKKVLVWWATAGGPGSAAPISTIRDPGRARDCESPVENPRSAPGRVEIRGGVFVVCGDGRRLKLDRVEIDGREGDGKEFADVLRDGIQLGGP
jgi:UDP-4-amino-4-deoxy-L-arabinose formyltransferase/UDP-glucuronic acid dehydrogenase (UDP-4-keto-hexauronic acid decarboxylating)